ncbi:protein-disulfide reductase DsbD [Alkalimonas collagenimarina]|uniref:Thiol:disulfide interchange protein DsbD n=1 Tax=Alkalimonas collagenimarina TaxID=400390 RepID=A0ABT9GVM2_9GAMM|nr:protein-disulfide reductase DsbD [Alkalimonas collagenimarina]MDP4535101.1 protein-disulfide reductase DsbD [Alkalimonas collagenimarina]
MLRVLLTTCLLFCLTALPLQANNSVLSAITGESNQFLPVDEAFEFDFRQQDGELLLSWTIADGYYLYKEQFKFAGIAVSFSHPSYPAAMTIEDEFFGVTDVYYHQVLLRLPLTDISEDAELRVRYQGCAEAGFCYPPTTKTVPLSAGLMPSGNDGSAQDDLAAATTSTGPVSSQNTLADRLAGSGFLLTLGVFFLLGLGLAFTPCVFPMYPILSSIIVGQGKSLSNKKAFTLSFAYVQGMALTYALLGLVIASLGVRFQAMLQHPAILLVVSALFVLLALAMFGALNFSLPSAWQAKVAAISNKQKQGSSKGAFVMGALSGLIASPCTTAPLTAALIYVAQSGDLLRGAITLYVLSLGMGLPLLLLGSSGGKLLPKAGQWMYAIKNAFGFLLLAVPIWLLDRFVPGWITVVLGSALALATALYLYYLSQQVQSAKARSALWLPAQLLLILTVLINVNIWWPQSSGNQNPTSGQQSSAMGQFTLVANQSELEQALAAAKANGQFVLLDLYAEWCVACKEFELLTFPADAVQPYMQQMVLLKIDVTRMTRADQQLLDQYQVLGLPTLLFFGPDGSELTQSRVTGFMAARPFARHLAAILDSDAQ